MQLIQCWYDPEKEHITPQFLLSYEEYTLVCNTKLLRTWGYFSLTNFYKFKARVLKQWNQRSK